jgi:hypothetical protein
VLAVAGIVGEWDLASSLEVLVELAGKAKVVLRIELLELLERKILGQQRQA